MTDSLPTNDFTPGFSNFAPGDTIINQGDNADLVYTLIEGHADAVCDGVKVGEIHQNEIFGALAVFTGQPRIASVVARTECTVMMVNKDDFVQLIYQQPQISVGVIEEMAAKINELNSQILSLKK
ncbi:MAG: cyclic nucleotide-binding domain-containing protein [Cellvibrio sp.]|nr:cyclic nucleotide-binding domain-containing protein [Cellvibrio sp.]